MPFTAARYGMPFYVVTISLLLSAMELSEANKG